MSYRLMKIGGEIEDLKRRLGDNQRAIEFSKPVFAALEYLKNLNEYLPENKIHEYDAQYKECKDLIDEHNDAMEYEHRDLEMNNLIVTLGKIDVGLATGKINQQQAYTLLEDLNNELTETMQKFDKYIETQQEYDQEKDPNNVNRDKRLTEQKAKLFDKGNNSEYGIAKMIQEEIEKSIDKVNRKRTNINYNKFKFDGILYSGGKSYFEFVKNQEHLWREFKDLRVVHNRYNRPYNLTNQENQDIYLLMLYASLLVDKLKDEKVSEIEKKKDILEFSKKVTKLYTKLVERAESAEIQESIEKDNEEIDESMPGNIEKVKTGATEALRDRQWATIEDKINQTLALGNRISQLSEQTPENVAEGMKKTYKSWVAEIKQIYQANKDKFSSYEKREWLEKLSEQSKSLDVASELGGEL